MSKRDDNLFLQKRNKDLFDEITFVIKNNIDDVSDTEVG